MKNFSPKAPQIMTKMNGDKQIKDMAMSNWNILIMVMTLKKMESTSIIVPQEKYSVTVH